MKIGDLVQPAHSDLRGIGVVIALVPGPFHSDVGHGVYVQWTNGHKGYYKCDDVRVLQ